MKKRSNSCNSTTFVIILKLASQKLIKNFRSYKNFKITQKMAFSQKISKFSKKKAMSKNVLELRFTYYIKVSASSDGYIKSPPTN